MNRKTLNKITTFQGDIHSCFEFLLSIYDELGFKQNLNLKAHSNRLDSFGNAIRSYRCKGLIAPVGKNGTRLILNGFNVLQYLFVQRALLAGAKLIDLVGIIPTLTQERLIELIQLDSISINNLGLDRLTKSNTPSTSYSSRKGEPRWHWIKIKSGIQLLVDSTKHTDQEIDEMTELLNGYLESRSGLTD